MSDNSRPEAKDDGTGLTPIQQQAIAALLTSTSVRHAARCIGVNERTIYRWLGDPVFKAALREAENQIVGEATRLLASGAPQAVATLLIVMADEQTPPAVRIRAALGALDQLRQLRTNADIEERLADLEVNSKNGTNW